MRKKIYSQSKHLQASVQLRYVHQKVFQFLEEVGQAGVLLQQDMKRAPVIPIASWPRSLGTLGSSRTCMTSRAFGGNAWPQSSVTARPTF